MESLAQQYASLNDREEEMYIEENCVEYDDEDEAQPDSEDILSDPAPRAGAKADHTNCVSREDWLVQPEGNALEPLEFDAATVQWVDDKIKAKKEQKYENKGKRQKLSIDIKDKICDLYQSGYSFYQCQLTAGRERFFVQCPDHLIVWMKNRRDKERKEPGKGQFVAKKRSRESGSGRPEKVEGFSKSMFEWFSGERALNHVVKYRHLLEKVRSGSPSVNCFKWIEAWQARWKICRRVIKRRSTLSESEMIERATKFHRFNAAFDPHIVVNLDEVPVALSGSMSSDRITYEHKGSTEVSAFCNANYSKRAASFIPFLAYDYETRTSVRLRPILLHKAAIKKQCVSRDHNCVNIANESGVMNEQTMLSVVIPHLVAAFQGRRVLVVLDSARSHITRNVLDALRTEGFIPSVIPGGMTQYLQAIDVDFAATFKRTHMALFDKEIGTATLTSHEQRTSLAMLVDKAFHDVYETLDLAALFSRLGYYRPLPEEIRLRGLEQYKYVAAAPVPAPVQVRAATAAPRRTVSLLNFGFSKQGS